MPNNRREFLQKILALVPASIIGRGFLKSANVPKALRKSGTPLVMAESVNGEIPDGWHLYELCGQSIFPFYGASGGLCTQFMAYLVRRKPITRNVSSLSFDDRLMLGRSSGVYADYDWECIPLEFTDMNFIAVDRNEEAVKGLINAKIAYAIQNRTPQRINMDGGNFPRAPQAERDAESAWFQREINRLLPGAFPSLWGAPPRVIW